LGSPWIRPRSFSPVLNGLLFGWTLRMYQPNLKSVSLPVHEIIAIEVLGGCEPQSWGRGGRKVPFERALVISYRPSIVTFHLSLRVSEISPLLCSSTPLFPTPPSQNVPMFPWEYVDGLWATKSEGAGLIVRQLVSKISDLCGPEPSTSQTDGQTCNFNTALCTRPIEHRAVISCHRNCIKVYL